jgi:hypothetical protein
VTRERFFRSPNSVRSTTPSSPIDWGGPAAIGLLVLGFSIVVGFLGAPRGEQFDWRLAAEVGTALGTVMLAVYTAWLARTTRREVNVAIEEQRARDRPVVVAVKREVGRRALDVTIGKTTAVLFVDLDNVGSGPAFHVQVHASYPEHGERALSVLPLLKAGEGIEDYAISLTTIPEPIGGFLVENFTVGGDFLDRSDVTHQISVRHASGLRDEQRAAERLAAVRAALNITRSEQPEARGGTTIYKVAVLNVGQGRAEDILIHVLSKDGSLYIEPIHCPDIAGRNRQALLDVRLPFPHESGLLCRLTWNDGTGAGAYDAGDAIFSN